MDFKKRKDYSTDKDGFFFQISHDEFVHVHSSGTPKVITWMKGKNRVQRLFEFDVTFGIIDNALFHLKDNIIKKAHLADDKMIVITDCVKIDTRFVTKYNFSHYFVGRNNNRNAIFAIPINQDYRSTNGIKFNISIDNVQKFFQVHCLGNFLFGINILTDSSSICRHQSDSKLYLVKGGLPKIVGRSFAFNNWIFYMTKESDLVSVNMIDLSWEITKTKLDGIGQVQVNFNGLSLEMKKARLDEMSRIVGINEKGIMNIQTSYVKANLRLFSAQLHEKYLVKTNRIPSEILIVDPSKKKKEELEKKIEELVRENEELKRMKEKIAGKSAEELESPEMKIMKEGRIEEKEMLLKEKEELFERNATLELEHKALQQKYKKLLIRIGNWDSDHNTNK